MKTKQLFFLLCAMMLMAEPLSAQRAMTVQDVQDFQHISFKQLSNDGKWVISVTEPWRGDGDRNGNVRNFTGDATAKIFDAEGNLLQTFAPISNIGFSNSSKYVVLSTKVSEAEKEAFQLKEQQKKGQKTAPRDPAGTPQDARGQKPAASPDPKVELPMDQLHIYQIGGGVETIDSLRAYKLSEKSDWLAYQVGKKDSTLHVRTLGGNEILLSSVTSYQFSTDGNALCVIAAGSGIDGVKGLFLLKKGESAPTLIKEGSGEFKGITFMKEGNTFAFLFMEKKDQKGAELWVSKSG
ncbi:MAG: hypothetical protein HUJ90_00190, partial [Bacteroidales bacterium]|nr:hypothetical protein [Bacteroidales bacterium]